MQLIILASGRGSRLKKNTKNKPKIFLNIFKDLTIFDFISKNFEKFKNVILVAGYKFKFVKKKILNFQINLVRNFNFKNTNMVESLFLTRRKITEDIIIVYGDIVFDDAIIDKLIKQRGSCLPLNSNWKEIWTKRMGSKKFKFDAEDVVTKGSKIVSIGNKITKKLPKLQFMGIAKFSKSDYFKLFKFYKKISNKKIDFTSFLNLSIKNKIIKLNFFQTQKRWLEIDNTKDYILAKKIIKNDLFKNHK